MYFARLPTGTFRVAFRYVSTSKLFSLISIGLGLATEIVCKAVQPEKQLDPKDITVLGIYTEVKDVA
jgi:hypothetical protein